MKKLLFSAFMMVAAATTFTSCQKEVQPIAQQSLSSQIGADADFAKMIDASISLGTNISDGISDAALAEEIKSSKSLQRNLNDFATSFQALEDKYELSKMSSTELTKTIQDAINSNPTLKSKLTATANINGKAAVTGAAICKLVVLLAKTFGGGALCTAINVSTIPVVGGVLCTALLTVASNILNAACDLIP